MNYVLVITKHLKQTFSLNAYRLSSSHLLSLLHSLSLIVRDVNNIFNPALLINSVK